jgi:PBP1b-binding outer membrane lipoprotein LpoB
LSTFEELFETEKRMKEMISFLLTLAVFLGGCACEQTNPAATCSTDHENPSFAAIEAPLDNSMDVEEVEEQVTEDAAVDEQRSPDVIFVPTPQDVVDKMLELVKLTKDDLIYDLGCGDGRIVVT